MAVVQDFTLNKLGMKKVREAEGIVEYRMKNGLKILLREQHSAPIATLMIVYRVGSRNEAVGHTGSTHFLEHMMFKGTQRFNPATGSGVIETLSRIGAFLNASTSMDRTNYFECVPKEYLELCIEFEADRMRNLNLRQEDRDTEMSVVRNEFEQGENDSNEALQKEVVAASFREHPYHHPVIGWRADVENVPMSKMKEFYDTYYHPNNATAIIVGDFDPVMALYWMQKYFGKIPSSSRPIPEVYTQEPAQEGERRVQVFRNGGEKNLLMAYHVPAAADADAPALSVLQAVLGSAMKRNSRLYKALVQKRLASSCAAYYGQQRDPFLFMIAATPAPDRSFEQVEKAIEAVLDILKNEPLSTGELQRIKAANRKGTVLAADDPLTLAEMLCHAESVSNWYWLFEFDEALENVTAEDVMRVASRYFFPGNRTVGHFIPEEKGTQKVSLPLPGASQLKTAPEEAQQREAQVIEGARLPLANPASFKSDFGKRTIKEVLANGLTLLVMANPGSGSVAVHGSLPAGTYFAPPELSMIPAATAAMLTRGSENYSREDLAKLLEEMGIRFGFRPDRFKVSFGTLMDKEDLPRFLPALADLIRRPLFSQEELDIVLAEMKSGLVQGLNDTGVRAENALMRNIFPQGHPFFENSLDECLVELSNYTQSSVRDFHERHFGPSGTVITVVGDVQPELAVSLLKEQFADWQGNESMTVMVPVVNLPARAKRIDIDMPDKAAVDILVGLPASVYRDSEDFFAAQLANAALGKDTISSRLGKILRVKHGLTYGIYSQFDDNSFGGAPWLIRWSVNPASVSKSLNLVQEVVATYLQQGISEEELEDWARSAVGKFLVSLRSSSGIAAALTYYESIGLGITAMDELAVKYMSVKRDDVLRAIRKHFHLERAITVVAGALSQIK